jgi:hypothetical protein
MRRRPDLLLWITFAVHAAGLLPARTGSAQSDLPRTVAETSQYQATARHADVLQFVDALDQRADHVRRLDFGASVEGRPLIRGWWRCSSAVSMRANAMAKRRC